MLLVISFVDVQTIAALMGAASAPSLAVEVTSAAAQTSSQLSPDQARAIAKEVFLAAFRPDAKKARFRSVQSTPLFTKDGNVLGMVSTHFAHAHEPTTN